MSLGSRIKNLILKFKTSLMQLNIFADRSYGQVDVRLARIFTRFYLMLAFISISIIIFYTFISTEMVTKTKSLHSLEQYENLEEKYKHLLSCPCSTISVHYSDIIEIQPTYHQLCQSDFVKNEWVHSLKEAPGMYAITGFRVLHFSYFFSLALICNTFK